MITGDRIKANGCVDLWDCGPQIEPEEPFPFVLSVADSDFDERKAEFDKAMQFYKAAKAEWDAWKSTNFAPRSVELFAVDAAHALERDPGRWRLDLRSV